MIRLAQRTVCDRCGAVCKSEENVATFTFDLSRYNMANPEAEVVDLGLISGEMDLCDECVPVVVGLIKKRVVIEHSNPLSFTEAEAPAKADGKKKAAPRTKKAAEKPAPSMPLDAPAPAEEIVPFDEGAEYEVGVDLAAAPDEADLADAAGLNPTDLAADFDRAMAESEEDDDTSIETID